MSHLWSSTITELRQNDFRCCQWLGVTSSPWKYIYIYVCIIRENRLETFKLKHLTSSPIFLFDHVIFEVILTQTPYQRSWKGVWICAWLWNITMWKFFMGGIRWGYGWTPVPSSRHHFDNGVGGLFWSICEMMTVGVSHKFKPEYV